MDLSVIQWVYQQYGIGDKDIEDSLRLADMRTQSEEDYIVGSFTSGHTVSNSQNPMNSANINRIF